MKKIRKSKNLAEILEILKKHQKELRERFGIRKIKIFGSYAANKQTSKSDLDIIVEFEKIPGLIELVGIEEELNSLIGVKVDLLTEEGISPYIREYMKEKEFIML